jgi:hypothetical protein
MDMNVSCIVKTAFFSRNSGKLHELAARSFDGFCFRNVVQSSEWRNNQDINLPHYTYQFPY